MLEYRSVVCVFHGIGVSEEIRILRINGQEQPEWKGRRWVDYLNTSARDGWELVTVNHLGGGLLVHFKREI
ncbi:hypothetical protein H6F67_13455 [Microcoleus sp. FACHB-1515]|uniref:hypothetical protein n=1 Tax=Cyanophyceae TaxID=3028117 RepID=UPI0016872EA1|nr:hypothetical protein [Microcoleus sp. FACHB-1515]MBD2090857.1 hypothetical protein [Microcoleus sp. FACHB-1515]